MVIPYRTVAVLKGGISSEREVSLRSGAAVARGLRVLGCEAIEVDVTERRFTLPSAAEAVFIALHGAYGEDGGVQRELEAMGFVETRGRGGTVVAPRLDDAERHRRALELSREYAAAMTALGVPRDEFGGYLDRV